MAYLASGKPILSSASGATKNTIEESGAGVSTSPGDTDDIISKLCVLKIWVKTIERK